MADTVGQFDVRGENISRVVKVFAQKLFKLKPLLTQVSSSKWTETYYKETQAILTAGGTRNIKEIGRLSQFPTVEASWTKVSDEHFKYGDTGTISMEDILTDAIDVQSRTMFKISQSIANSIDAAIYAKLTAEGSTSGVVAAVANWDSTTVASRDPIRDILTGIQAMMENNYDALSGGVLLLTPKDHRNLMMNSKVINNPSFKTADVVSNGVVGMIAGLRIVVSTTVTADEAMIIIDQRSATWQSVVGMTAEVTKKPGVSTTITAWEIGQIQITDPLSLYTITGTQE